MTESLRIEVLSRGHSYGVTIFMLILDSKMSKLQGHSYGVTKSLGIAFLSRALRNGGGLHRRISPSSLLPTSSLRCNFLPAHLFYIT